jgi:RES domain-containing protein
VLDRKLLARVDALQPTTLSTEAFRHIAKDRHPLSGAGARLQGGRWNPPESFSTLYLALAPATVVAEFYRMAERQGRAPADFLPRQMHRYDVTLAAALDLRSAEAQDSLDLTPDALQALDAKYCQEIGAAARYLGFEGIIAPSATGTGTVLAVFFEGLRAESNVVSVEDEEWVALPPEPSDLPPG